MSGLVIGGSGLLGGHLLDLRRDAIGTYRRVARPGLRQLDLAEPDGYRRLLDEAGPVSTVVVATNPPSLEWCESRPDDSRRELVEHVAGFLGSLRATNPAAVVAFISTDYVFDGEQGGYREDDAPRPLQAYGRHKLEAEGVVKGSGLPYWIIRTSLLFGENRWAPSEPLSLPLRLVDCARRGAEVMASADLRSSPTEARSLASAVWALGGLPAGGVLHAAGGPPMTRLEFARATLQEWKLPDWPGLVAVTADAEGRLPGQTLRRPRDSSLDSTRLRSLLGRPLPDASQGLHAVRERLEQLGVR